MAAIYVNGVPYEYMSGYSVRFPDDWQGEMTEVRLTDRIEGSRIRNLYISNLPDTIRKLYVPAGIESLTFARGIRHELEEIEVDQANKMYSTDGHALYSADGKALFCLVDRWIETYAIDSRAEYIDYDAFHHCERLKKIIIPVGAARIGVPVIYHDGFAMDCPQLKELEVAEDNPVFCTDGKAIYSKDKKILHFLAVDNLESYAVENGTEKIMGYAFNGRSGLKRVILPASVSDVADLQCDHTKAPLRFEVCAENPYLKYQDDAFYSADGKHLILLTKDIECCMVCSDVEVIDARAFWYARSLKAVILPQGLRKIDEHAFSRCESLDTLGWRADTPEKQFIFPDALEEIGNLAFSQGDRYFRKAHVDELVIGKNIRRIGEKAFSGFRCRRFTALGCTELGERVFENARIESLLLPGINPSKIKKSIQELAVSSYCEAALRREECCEIGKKQYLAFLKRNSKRYAEQMIENQSIIRVMLANKLIEDTQIDNMLEKLDGEKYADFKAELVNYAGSFATDGTERMMKQFEEEIRKDEQKQKREEKKASYESLTLAERASTKYKLSPQAKVELLEEVVLHGTLEDLCNVCRVYGSFEFMARALAMAVRCRAADFTEELLRNGATFVYESTPAFTRKYDCMIKETNKYSYAVNYATLIFEKMHWRLKIERLADVPVSSIEERCRSLALICAAENSEKPLKNLLYHAILRGEKEIVNALKAGGINQLDAYDASTAFQVNFVSMDAASICERNTFFGSMPWEEPDKLRWMLDELLLAGNGRTICFSRPELTTWRNTLFALCSKEVFDLAMNGKVDLSKAKPSELISACLKAGNLKGLQYALDQGWVADKKAISKTAKQLGIEDAAALEWLSQA